MKSNEDRRWEQEMLHLREMIELADRCDIWKQIALSFQRLIGVTTMLKENGCDVSVQFDEAFIELSNRIVVAQRFDDEHFGGG